MTRMWISMACGALALALGACGESHQRSTMDASVRDAAHGGGLDAGAPDAGDGIPRDAGDDGGRDAGEADGGRDAASDGGSDGGPDSGPAIGTCEMWSDSPIPKLRERCLPRCTAATRTCFYACRDDQACADACVASDTEPALSFILNGRALGELSCDRCLSWQTLSCHRDSCPDEIDACSACPGSCSAEPGCEEEEASLAACMAAKRAEIDSCVEGRRAACFP